MNKLFLIALLSTPLLAATAAQAETVRIIKNVIYGPHQKQRMDVYLPPDAENAPVILMVHGGSWRYGDKSNRHVVRNKARRWVNSGFIFVSVNYRLLPEAGPLKQAEDIALALKKAQQMSARWGGDRSKFILMGHSSGAHLVSLLNADPALLTADGIHPWLGTIALDSAVMDVPTLMQNKHPQWYDDTFGHDPNHWQRTSPAHQLAANAPPLLIVCALYRPGNPCQDSRDFKRQADKLGLDVQVLPQAISHGAINDSLGTDSPYTRAVEDFIRSLDPQLAVLLHG